MQFDHLDNSFYFNYYQIGQGAYRDKVKYFEDNKDDLHTLEVQQQYEVKFDYLLCLFEIGRYEYFLGRVDEMIETAIVENIYEYNGTNIYNELLFRKSACLYNLNRYSESEKILKAIIKLDSKNSSARLLYTRCRRKFNSPKNEVAKGIVMVFLISALSISFMELFIVKPFYVEYIKVFSTLKVFFAISAITILIGSELYFKYDIGKDIGYNLNLKQKLSSINKWFLDLTGGKIGNDPF